MTVTTKTIEELEAMEATIERGLKAIKDTAEKLARSDDRDIAEAGKRILRGEDAVHDELTDLRGSFPDWPMPEGGGNK